MQQHSIECAHDLCQCTVMSGMREEKYCSDACRHAQQDGIESETCKCGHPPCDVP